MSARSLVAAERAATIAKPPRRKVFASVRTVRAGSPTNTEKEMVAQFVQDQPREVTERQVAALATVLRRSKEVVRRMVEEARENFVASAQDYVAMHKQAVQSALANGDAKSLEVVVKGTQWAMENLQAEGVRIIDKAASEGASGPRIMIGVQVGGKNDQAPAITVTEAKG